VSVGDLPTALQPWRRWLAWFAPEVTETIGDLVRQLHPVLGPFGQGRRHAPGEPDGLDGLQARGAYERLLPGEWLLADELPDEFLRRAAAGEHLFLSPRPSVPQAGREIVALFDAGPLQLGTPRLVHLAWWVLLARRAAEAGATLRWGFVQAPVVFHGTDPVGDLARLREGRSFEVATPAHRQAWAQVLGPLRDTAHEHWWIGADDAAAAPAWITHAVQVRRDPRGDRLDVGVAQGGQLRRLSLDLPSPRQGAALLRGTWLAVTPHSDWHDEVDDCLATDRPPLFSASGSHVAVRSAGGTGAWVMPVHARRGSERKSPRWVPWGAAQNEPWTLFFRQNRQLAGLLTVADRVLGWRVKAFFGIGAFPPGVPLQPVAGLPSLCTQDDRGNPCVWVLAGGALLKGAVRPDRGTASWRLLEEGVVGMAQVGDVDVTYLQGSHTTAWALKNARGSQPLTGLGPDDAVDAVLFCHLSFWLSHQVCAVRLGRAPERWRLFAPSCAQSVVIELAEGWTAIGVCRTPGSPLRHHLVCIAADARRVYKVDATGATLCHSVPTPILSGSVCPANGRMALLTAQALIVVDVVEERLALWVDGEAGHAD
jgi:hypothetical protein